MDQFKLMIIRIFMIGVHTVVETYTVLTLPIYKWLQKPERNLKLSATVKARQLNSGDPYSPWIRSDDKVPYHVLTKCTTVAECYQIIKELYAPDRPAIGFRTVLSEEVVTDGSGNVMRVDGKVLRKFRLSNYKWLTYGQIMEMAEYIAKGLLVNGFRRESKVVSLVDTNPQNVISAVSMAFVGAVGVTVFPTLGEKGIIHAINQTKAEYIYTSYDLLSKASALVGHCPSVKSIIYVESSLPTINCEPINIPSHINVWSLEKLLADGKSAPKHLTGVPLELNDVCVIGYTSGTTGEPKAAYATGGQMKEAFMATLPVVEKFMKNPEHHTYIAYLPQTHIFEAGNEILALLGGVQLGFATPFTLNESAPGLADGEVCDLKLLKPTLMAAVPLVLERMRKEMYHKLSKRTIVSTALFDYLIDYKIKWTQRGYNTPIVNALVCSKVREQFGGRLEHMVVGGAALSPKLQSLVKASLNVNLVQGYGATETLGPVLCMDDYDLSYGRVGAPLFGIQIKLTDWLEGGYTVGDIPNARGEIVVGSRGVAEGYYDNEEMTGEAFEGRDENGLRWFRTGDIGEVCADGGFKIIDRKKDLIKLANGEYFSLGKIEAALKNSIYVENICVIGDSNGNSLVALVTPNLNTLQLLSKKFDLNDTLLENLCSNPDIVCETYNSLVIAATQQNLNRREIPALINICCDEWTPDNGLLTPALKLKRVNIHKKYRQTIDRMFKLINYE